ncbi:MAG TPA: ATP-binding protein [Oligoflexus sp.]|uniref:chemotaxis protein CheA n=1 Tax=Oligoflexus sp. TaxID=1971216 RepID=UPI002D4B39C8|nr:ATP-binding protein [Oligoflexus sp.]HYX35218.1 ATP-binding protein [Oligoflexus sp.]
MQLRDEAIQEYRDECQDLLERIRATLTAMGQTGPAPEHDRALALDFQTMKGSAEVFGFQQIARLAESLQSADVRVDLILKGLDHIQRLLEMVKKDRQEHADSLSTEFCHELARLRMQPISSILNRYPRMVSDLARDLSKVIELKLEGTAIKLDPAMLEALKDPLTHIIRNAVDHGIESPADRLAQHKPEQGTVTVRASLEEERFIIEIADDGRGLNRKKIAEKAIQEGLMTAESVQHMSDQEAWQLIFAPGLSTADHVTTLSGRGVGMDLVRTHIDRIGGQVDLKSVPGAGTTVVIKILRKPISIQPW